MANNDIDVISKIFDGMTPEDIDSVLELIRLISELMKVYFESEIEEGSNHNQAVPVIALQVLSNVFGIHSHLDKNDMMVLFEKSLSYAKNVYDKVTPNDAADIIHQDYIMKNTKYN